MVESSDKTPSRIRGYRVERVLGRGAMGEVLLAIHPELGRAVAIKRYLPAGGTRDDQQNRDRFLREGTAMARLHHQGIVGIYDYFEHRGQLYMVLEYVDGVAVADLLEHGPLPQDVACIVGLKLAEAVQHAHFHRIIHRDIKTSNVMVSRNGQVKLMDFGIARGELLEKVTQTGMLVGTPAYFAPEVIEGGEASELSDVYGMGAVLYHCLTGRKLFYHVEGVSLYAAVKAGRFVPLDKAVRGVPRGLRTIVHTCLAHDPANRYPSAAALRQTLDLYMADQGIWSNHAERLAGFLRARGDLGEPPPTAVEISVGDLLVQSSPVLRPARKRRWSWILAGIVLLLGAVAWFAYEKGWIERALYLLGLD